MQISDEDLTLLKNATASVHARVEKLGKAFRADFRADELYRRPNPFEATVSAIKSIDNTIGAIEGELATVARIREENAALTKQVSDLTTFAGEQVEKFEQLAKGRVACSDCDASGKVNEKPCQKCEGEKYVSVR